MSLRLDEFQQASKMNRKQKRKNRPGNSEPEESSRSQQQHEKREAQDPASARAEAIRTEGGRETVEALVVAFILALLFRAFIAEAFVIPTGSMAPTLMGAHKDVFCDRCNFNFPVGASWERSNGPFQRNTVVAGICPNCRHVNAMDLAEEPGHSTFNGDRILVSKFSYTMSDPDRWDVIVFKFPGNPKQNYIKRLVGLPNETITVSHGDVYSRRLGDDVSNNEILRRPEDKLLAMRHVVHDSNFQSMSLVNANYPCNWQPWRKDSTEPPDDSWQVKRDANGMTATVEADGETQWLRYFHRWADEQQWNTADNGGSLEDVDPYSGRLISDFYAYNSFVHVDSDRVYRSLPGENIARARGPMRLFLNAKAFVFGPDFELNETYESGGPPAQFGRFASFGGSQDASGRDGLHWVGDLLVEAELETSASCKSISLFIVEAGVRHLCEIDLTTGKASLSLVGPDGNALAFDGGSNPVAQTGVRAGSTHQIRLSNCDDQMLLWVDEQIVEFDGPTTFDSSKFFGGSGAVPRFLKGVDPMDAAPVAIGASGGKATVNHLKIDRDKYYIATKNSSRISDYDSQLLWEQTERSLVGREIQVVFGMPEQWENLSGIWNSRRSVSFDLQEDQFFPMGDNSPASLDARCWAGSKVQGGLPNRFRDDAYRWARAEYVPRDLLVGKALLVFWPHPWSRPVPMTPNFKKFRLIR